MRAMNIIEQMKYVKEERNLLPDDISERVPGVFNLEATLYFFLTNNQRYRDRYKVDRYEFVGSQYNKLRLTKATETITYAINILYLEPKKYTTDDISICHDRLMTLPKSPDIQRYLSDLVALYVGDF